MLRKYFLIIFIFLININFTFCQVNLKSGLIACFPFNGNANDVSGNNHKAIVNGATLSFDRMGNKNSSYFFNGVSNFIELEVSKLKNETYSFVMWVKPQSIPLEGLTQVYLSIGNAEGDQNLSLNKGYSNGTDGFTGSSYLDFNKNTFCQSKFLPDVTKWYHLSYIRDKNKGSLYINGAFLCSSLSSGINPFYGNGIQKATLGKRSNGDRQFAHGEIDDIQIYNRPLNNEEIKTIYEGVKISNFEINITPLNPCSGEKISINAVGNDINVNFNWKINNKLITEKTKSIFWNSQKSTTDYNINIELLVSNELDLCFPSEPKKINKSIKIITCPDPPKQNSNYPIPNIFTPNQDGKNETWEINSIKTISDVDVKVFDRWGNLIFHSIGYCFPWDGTFKNEPVMSGAYNYTIKINPDYSITGSVYVIR
jgi:gliding motility-associated-like protein